jgi:chemotaxis signal transduction protein
VSREDPSLDAVAAELRREFDQSFAAAPSPRESAESAMLLLGIGDERLAVRLGDIAGLVRCQGIVGVPSRAPDLLGIAGIRGGVAPVFSLALLIGQSRDPEPPDWLLLCGTEPLALAFQRFLGHLRASADAFRPIPATEKRSPHVDQAVTLDEVPIPVLSVGSIIRFIAERNTKES